MGNRICTHLSRLNISSRAMKPSPFRSYTRKQKAVLSSRLPRRNTDRPQTQSSSLTTPQQFLSKAQKMRSMRTSSVTRSKVLCSSSRNTTRSRPYKRHRRAQVLRVGRYNVFKLGEFIYLNSFKFRRSNMFEVRSFASQESSCV